MKTRVYIESSVISYLTAKPSSNQERLNRQKVTTIFWDRRDEWEFVISFSVLDEISQGDPDAAEKRLAAVAEFPILPPLPDDNRLPELLVMQKAVPAEYYGDAMHLSLAAVYSIPYIVTWNQKHLDNLKLKMKIDTVIREQGYIPAVVTNPERWMEDMT